jgi:hypothetical protein
LKVRESVLGYEVAEQSEQALVLRLAPASSAEKMVRPMISLIGAKNHVLVDNLEPSVLPASLGESFFTYIALAQACKQINATKGSVGVRRAVAGNLLSFQLS